MRQYKPLFILKNIIKTYAWGTLETLPKLLQYENEENEPQAELWMGTHPNGTSFAILENQLVSLQDLIQTNPIFFLGEAHITKYGKQLPFLLKVLAIGTPLSLQVHPSKEHAEEGFDDENHQHIPSNSPTKERLYKDDNHKQELLLAYDDEFWALCGFQSYQSIIDAVLQVSSVLLNTMIADLIKNPSSQSLQTFIYGLLSLSQEKKDHIIEQVMTSIKSQPDSLHSINHPYYWINRLWLIHPHDIAILAPLYMNMIHVPKNKAIFVESGTLHSYLQGIGIEILTLSDNVIRFGLTPKPIDISSLNKIVKFVPTRPEILKINSINHSFTTPCQEFLLSYHTLDINTPFTLNPNNTAQIMLVLNGDAYIYRHTHELYKVLKSGESIFIPYNAGAYYWKGDATLFIASVPSLTTESIIQP
ncbi:mannose-6-phosphate isomerase, class I [Entomospira entomophila]|uniref:mannose-6-phosphate isomerase n=1 Tax=Entomospira entomophila TaxID=2719988 RepID=A0A968G8T5_9SPIO|nr:mannose-6-phosphate isomerase, class I [Entomospira entomophilus]NIZ40670.1 mannose-6-phosphate isomerase, class I [Entomospira entomophilus]WDI34884.1 mannose-6-phosphate isomerase, class I [Entomospira entomophilus]